MPQGHVASKSGFYAVKLTWRDASLNFDAPLEARIAGATLSGWRSDRLYRRGWR